MALKYTKVKEHPTIFLRLFGITPYQFEKIIIQLEPLWEKRILGVYKRPGRDFKLSMEEMVLLTLLYYRSYVSQLFVGFLFGIDDSRVCRLIRRIEPLLAQVVAISKYLSLTPLILFLKKLNLCF